MNTVVDYMKSNKRSQGNKVYIVASAEWKLSQNWSRIFFTWLFFFLISKISTLKETYAALKRQDTLKMITAAKCLLHSVPHNFLP